jgi:septal ring factor EnvC (AmiA/AmiB activator)
MTNNPPTLTYTLEEILSRLDQKIEKQFAEVNQKMDRQFTEVNQKMDRQFAEVNQKMDRQFAEVNQKMDRQFAEVNQKFTEVNKKLETMDGRLNKLEIGQAELSGEIKTLEEKVSGIDKRLDNQEFINRGVLVAVIIALISGVVKLFGFFPSSKI